MKKTIFILSTFLVLALVASAALFFELRSMGTEYNNLLDRHQRVVGNHPDTVQVISFVKDTVYNTSTTTYAPVQTTEDLTGYVSKAEADKMAEALNVAANKIDRLQSQLITIKAEVKGTRHKDTVTNTEWLTMKDNVFDVKVNLMNDSIFPSAKLRLTQAYAPYKKNMFSRTEYRSVIQANDHRVRISEIVDVNKVPKSSRWGISAFGGPIVSQQGLTYGAGLGLTFDLIQF